MRPISRRDFLASGLVTLGAALAGPAVWRAVLAAPAHTGPSPYGALGSPDANGLMLPAGFTSREVARSGAAVAGYTWHRRPDGGAVFDVEGGGWIYVSNSEIPAGGAGAVRFAPDGTVTSAYPILGGTAINCAGGPTPWGTWLSCEEHPNGRVWECDPAGEDTAVVHPGMGVFTHEAAAVDPVRRHVYMTEDHRSGRFYRFVPDGYPDLHAGRLEAAQVVDPAAVEAGGRSAVRWHPVPDPSARSARTRDQVAVATVFRGGEGCWYDTDVVYFTTKFDNRVWAYDAAASEIELLYAGGGPLSGVDNVTVDPRSGDVLVAEDGGNLEIVLITPDRAVAPLLRATGPAHTGSEIAGPAMSPDGTRLYFSSQRGYGDGVTYEVRGPFRTGRTRVDRGTQSPAATSEPSPSPAPSTPPPPATSPPAPTATPGAESSGDDGDARIAAAVAAGALAASGGALAWRNLRRTGRQPPSENP